MRLVEDAVRERPEGASSLGRAEVTAAFARRSGLPLALLSDDVQFRMAEVREHFEHRVLGQPRATSTVADLVAVLKAGLSDPSKPLASYFFVGPTGVGKTELAKALAGFLFGSRERLVRFDMAEYASPDAVQRLVGTSWGSSERELTRRVREQPFCVVLLDEIEKAHPSVFDALLALIGEGRLTDAAGRVADFRSAIVIMTSNLGASRSRSAALGFGGDQGLAGDRYVEEAERFFRPEFFNRIDRVVVFHPLAAATVEQIARLELNRLLTREGIVRRKLRVEGDDAVVGSVAAAGFHPRYGARPLHREIERSVIEPLARLLVDRRPTPDEFVRVGLVDGLVAVSIERTSPDDPEEPRRARPAKGETSFARSERLAAEFAAALLDDDAARSAGKARGEISALVRTSNETSFWDDPAAARETLQRIYRLELVVGRFEALCNRAMGLAEMARRVRETRHRARVNEVPRAVNEMSDELVVVRLELAAAAGGGARDAAVVRVVPIGADATPWAGRLLAMYEAWSARTGRDATRAGDGAGALRIEGPATLDILIGEHGLHRHVLLEGAEELARVSIAAPGERPTERDDPGLVVRVYEEGRRRVVRDPTTGARDSRVSAVLDEGRLETFLIAALAAPRRDDGQPA